MNTHIKILFACLFGGAFLGSVPADQTPAAETGYLTFQVQTGLSGYASQFHPPPGRFSLTKTQMEEFVRDVVKAIGMTGDARHKLAFAVGPLCFDMSDEETRQFIHDAFAVARENDVAVAFHIDDSMSWGQRQDLLSNPDNIETADWKQIPNTGRRADWGRKPTKFPPQMCFNSPAIVAAVKDRAGLIGSAIQPELAALKAQGKEHLFAGVIAGWETQLGRDLDTDRQLGYRALSHRGFSESHPPQDADLERVQVVKEFMELWANSLHAAGTPREKIFCHIAFTSQGLRAADAKESHTEKVHFALPEVAFSTAYRPGFSTYPEGATFREIYAALAEHGSPGWISAEGVNVSPTGMPGEPTMESYLARMFNHGAVMVNVFSWGIGGEAMRNNFFRRATENSEALAAYDKFLRGEALVETVATGFSSEAFQAKMHRIQTELPGWIQTSGQQALALALTQKIKALLKDKQWQAADKVADELLALMKGDLPKQAMSGTASVAEDLPGKIQKIQSELPAWVQGAADKKNQATALMKQLQARLKAKDYEAAGKTADDMLKLMSAGEPTPAVSTPATPDITEELRDKLAHNIGCSFLLFRTRVLGELQVTPEQKEKLDQHLRTLLPETLQVLQKSNGERGKYNQKTHKEMTVVLKEILTEDQRTRLHQLELQKDLLFGPGWNMEELQITDEQRKQFIAPTQETQKKTQTLMEEIHKGANPNEIRPKALQLRLDLEVQLEALLTDAQKKQWKEMQGQPVNLSVIYGGL